MEITSYEGLLFALLGVGLDSWGVGVQRKLSGEGKYTLHLEKSGNKINLSVKIS